jgi:hypothetical protein
MMPKTAKGTVRPTARLLRANFGDEEIEDLRIGPVESVNTAEHRA